VLEIPSRTILECGEGQSDSITCATCTTLPSAGWAHTAANPSKNTDFMFGFLCSHWIAAASTSREN